MSAPQPPTTTAPTATVEDVYSQVAKGNALALQMTSNANAANISALTTVATGAMMLKIIREPLSLDSIRSLMELMGAAGVEPPSPAPEPPATMTAAAAPAAPTAGADPLGTGIALET